MWRHVLAAICSKIDVFLAFVRIYGSEEQDDQQSLYRALLHQVPLDAISLPSVVSLIIQSMARRKGKGIACKPASLLFGL
jgi:hypothetical protein